MSMPCGKCCTDLTLRIQELLFPHAFLDVKGLDFYRTHGLERFLTHTENIEFEYSGVTYRISLLGLIRPDLYLDAEGQQFHADHHLDDLVRENATVRVKHRCQYLHDDRSCGIYESRPEICREFKCALRDDCIDPQVHPLEFRS
jgi:Fe-S-cluster containining protein